MIFIPIITLSSIIIYLRVNTEKEPNEVIKDQDEALETVILNGLTLQNNDERIYDKKELIIRGDIDLLDNSRLEITNSKIVVEPDYHKQYVLEARDNSTLTIRNCSYESEEWRIYNFEYFDNAQIHIEDFDDEEGPWQAVSSDVDAVFLNAIAGITIPADGDEAFTGSITVTNSDQVYFELDLKPGKTYDMKLPSGLIEEWHPDYFEGSIDVYNSTITNLDVDIWPGVDVTIRDSENFAVGWIFGDGWDQKYSKGKSAEIVGLREGYYKDLTIEANNAKLRLINTTFGGWWPIVTGEFELTVRDSDMVDPWAYNESIFNIYDSDVFYISATDEATVNIYNSKVDDSLVALENSRIELFNTELGGETSIEENARIYIDGKMIIK